MVDTRFHPCAGPLPLRAMLAQADETISVADDRAQFLAVSGADELDLAGPHDIALAASAGYEAALAGTRAGVVVVSPALAPHVPQASIAIVADQPHELFVDLIEMLYPADTRAVLSAGMAPADAAPLVEEDVVLGANVVLGPGVEIGRNSVIGANTVIGSGVAIGRNAVIGSNCSIDCAYLGNEVILQAGVRIGTEGFGWLGHGRTNRKIPQLGRVIIQDRVEIGANSTIDRGALGDTVIGEGTKIDNLVQIGHNCRIGRFCLVAATTGLSGSTILGDSVLVGGGVGTSGHLKIGSGSIIHGRAAVTKDWPAGSKLAGAPAQDIRDFWKELAVVRRMSRRERG
jgi:UDP-3-O-[3-hydroxymyristoyl] glucosamine N-acyltransferase